MAWIHHQVFYQMEPSGLVRTVEISMSLPSACNVEAHDQHGSAVAERVVRPHSVAAAEDQGMRCCQILRRPVQP